MRYLYKINSRYDGFTPQRIPERLSDERFLLLGWSKYIDAVHVGDEVWVVFIGGRFDGGAYARGLIASIDPATSTVWLRVLKYRTDRPLTDAPTTAAMLAAIDTRYRQVFLWPTDHQLTHCQISDCGAHRCLNCEAWSARPQIDPAHYVAPNALSGVSVAPAYWIIPPRCYLYSKQRTPAPWIRRVNEMFYAFKVGEERYTFPLAAGMQAALAARNLDGFDAIIPIPLSPEKIAARELDRTGALSRELGTLIGVRDRQYLSLGGNISKRRMLSQGFTLTQFKVRYRQLLQVDPAVANLQRVLLVDDVITKGTTLQVAVAALRAVNPLIEVVVASAGQMVVKAVVVDDNGPAW